MYDAAGTQTWELPATRPGVNKLARAGNWPGATAFVAATSTGEVSATNAQDSGVRRFVSDPIVGAQTISGTLQGQALLSENDATANALPQIMVKVVSGDGATLRGVAYGGDSRTTNVDELTISLRNQRVPATGVSPVTLTSVSALDGDRILAEIGARFNNTTTTSYTCSIRYGSKVTAGGANDLTAGGTETTDLNGWVEFSANINFDANQVSILLPDGVAAQSGYANATTANIANLHGDPDVSGGTGFTAS